MIAPLPEPRVDRAARIPHVAALDGLRGIAVIGVLFFHADHLSGGFLGVDLFFTLSGFLITSLLVVEHQRTGRISLRDFWARRARRLLPAMIAVVAAAAVVADRILPDDQMERFGGQALATLAYVANWGEIAGARDYWALFDAPTPLEHMWSLAIEEQFYVVWPLLVLGAVRLLGRRAGVRVLVGAGLVGSLAASWVLVAGDGGITRAYYGTDTRAASILVGAALATFTAGAARPRSGSESATGALALPAVLALLASWAFVDGSELWLYRYGFLVHALLTAVVIAAVSGPSPGLLGSLLSRRPLVQVGLLSYGLYLWHWPVYVVLDEARTGLDGWTLTAARFAVSFAIATASYHLLEVPIRSQRWRLPRPGLVAVGAMAATAVLVAAVGFRDTGGGAGADLALPGTSPSATTGDAPDATAGTLLVVGDSGPAGIAAELRAMGHERGLEVAVEAQVGCGLVGAGDGVHTGDGGFLPDPEGCAEWPERWAGLVADHRPDAVLLMVSWGGGGDRDIGSGDRLGPCDEDYDRYYAEQIRTAVRALGSTGAVVVLATAPPHGFDRSNDERTACLNELYTAATRGHPAELLDLAAWTCAHARCADGPDDVRPDGIHFSGRGAVDAARWIVDETSRLTGLDGLPFVVLVGDSQALRLVEHAPPFSELDLRVGSLAALGCGLSAQAVVMDGRPTGKQECVPTLDGLAADLADLEPDAVAVHAGVWEALDQVGADATVTFGEDAWEATLRANVSRTLEELAAGRDLIAITTPCFAEGPGRDAFGTDDLDARIEAYNDVLVQETLALGGTVVDLADHLCPDGRPRLEIDGTTVRPDGVHADRDGARVLWPWLATELRDAVRRY